MAIETNMRSIKNTRVWRNWLCREARGAGQGCLDETARPGVKELMCIFKMDALFK